MSTQFILYFLLGESTRSQGSMKSTLNLKAVKTKCKKQTNKPSAFQSDNNIKKVGNSPSQGYFYAFNKDHFYLS